MCLVIKNMTWRFTIDWSTFNSCAILDSVIDCANKEEKNAVEYRNVRLSIETYKKLDKYLSLYRQRATGIFHWTKR